MDRTAAALASSIAVLLFLIWREFQQVAPMTVSGDIKMIVLVGIVVVGLSVYAQSHAAR